MQAYELTAKGKKTIEGDALRGQPALVYAEIAKGAATAGEIAERLGKKLVTTQSPVIVVRHYLILWKRDGLVRFAPKTRRAK